jgi:cytidylate kinase
MIITIDGPSGTGKTSVAKRVAEALHFAYFDTGAMYRALTWLMLESQIELHEASEVQACIDNFDFHVEEEGGNKRYFVGHQDVSLQIRSPAVTQAVSAVAALPLVRSSLLVFQHRFAKTQDAVFEGRDLGTVVFPQAEIKIFLTADPAVRASRRLQELHEKVSYETVLSDLNRRDTLDSTREVAPLACPLGAFVIDTTPLSIDEVVRCIIQHYETRI